MIFIIGVLAIIIFSGAWNPFKSSEVSHEASVVYDKSEDTMKNIFETAKEISEKVAGTELGVPDAYLPSGEYPYGFEIKDYGKEGNDEGVLKYTKSVTGEVRKNFGSQLTTYYMINEDYAKEKYNSLQNNFSGTRDEYDFDGGKITFGGTMLWFYSNINLFFWVYDYQSFAIPPLSLV